MKESAADLPALQQFMGCYWMETADLVYGNLTGATQAFLQIESPLLTKLLPVELRDVDSAGYLVSRPAPGSKEEQFWQQFGARWLTSEDAELVTLLVTRHHV